MVSRLYQKVIIVFLNSSILFMIALLWNGLVHLVILKDFMPVLLKIRRPDFEQTAWLSMPLTFLLVFLFSIGLKAFAKDGTYKEGLIFGLYFGILAGVLVNFNQFLLYPVPGYMQLTWFGFGMVEFLVYGLVSIFVMFKFKRKK